MQVKPEPENTPNWGWRGEEKKNVETVTSYVLIEQLQKYFPNEHLVSKATIPRVAFQIKEHLLMA